MRFLIIVLMLVASNKNSYTQACCCTSAGANYSILPNLNKQVIGLRYAYSNYITTTTTTHTHMMGGKEMVMTDLGKAGTQTMNTLEMFGRFSLYKGLQLSVFVPVHVRAEKVDGQMQRTAGLGDMSFLLQYSLLNPLKCNGKETKHQLRLGAGAKLPSGEFKLNSKDLFSSSLQLGTGSVDFLMNAVYTLRFKKFGFNTTAAYKINTTNPQGYRFGNKFQAGTNFFFVLDVKEIKLMPSVGFNYEHQLKNTNQKLLLDYTGGDYMNASVGFDVYYKQFAFSSSITPAVMNKLNWTGESKSRFNVEMGVFYNFSITKK